MKNAQNNIKRLAGIGPAIGMGLLTLIAGCESLDNRTPKWVENPQKIYPEELYLVATGEGERAEEAEQDARINLFTFFEIPATTNETTETPAIIATDIATPAPLYTIQYSKAWTNEQERVHTTAYIDRNAAAALYRGKIDEKTHLVLPLLEAANQAANPLKKYALLRTAAREAAENAILLSQLAIIQSNSVAAVSPDYQLEELYQNLSDTAQKIRVRIKISSDTDRTITQTIEDIVASYGFILGEHPEVNIIGYVNISATDKTDELDSARYSLNIQIADAVARILVSINEKGRATGESANQAISNALQTLAESIKTNGAQQIDEYLQSLIQQPTE